tara:strand:+ start:478 stop:1146 length:669 start_codon:yes stop_codon:yes gene_type:complete
MYYSIIIPIYNEVRTLNELLLNLKKYYEFGHEIIIVDDGSTDGTQNILKKCFFIKIIELKKNSGKGFALKKGLESSINNKIIIYDGDLELRINEITKLMILNKSSKISSVMGIRFKRFPSIRSGFDWGNFIFSVFFNLTNMTCHKDVLCCAKSFYKKDIPLKLLSSTGFDIDVELSSIISKNNRGKYIPQIFLNYSRRSKQEGKKLKVIDGWIILRRIILNL